MDNAKKTQDAMDFAGQALDAVALWAETNQHIVSQLVELSAGAARESARLYAELQQTTVGTIRNNAMKTTVDKMKDVYRHN